MAECSWSDPHVPQGLGMYIAITQVWTDSRQAAGAYPGLKEALHRVLKTVRSGYATMEIPIPFIRHVFQIEIQPDKREWMERPVDRIQGQLL
jgi:hypothetical protein